MPVYEDRNFSEDMSNFNFFTFMLRPDRCLQTVEKLYFNQVNYPGQVSL